VVAKTSGDGGDDGETHVATIRTTLNLLWGWALRIVETLETVDSEKNWRGAKDQSTRGKEWKLTVSIVSTILLLLKTSDGAATARKTFAVYTAEPCANKTLGDNT
jgi:hypothetical protein